MAKATALSPDLMNAPAPAQDAPRVAMTPTPGPGKKQKKAEPLAPVQLRWPASEIKDAKRAALEADQTVSEFMLACFHACMKKRARAEAGQGN